MCWGLDPKGLWQHMSLLSSVAELFLDVYAFRASFFPPFCFSVGWTGKGSHMQLVSVEQIRHFPFSKNKSQSAGGTESTVTFLLSLALPSAAALLLFFSER